MLSKKPKSQFSLEFSCKKEEIIAILHHNSIEIEQKKQKRHLPKNSKKQKRHLPKNSKKAETPSTPIFS